MRVLLIHPSIREWAPACNLPLGAAYTAAALKHADIEVRVFDDNVRRADDVTVLAELNGLLDDCDLVGISAMCSQYKQVKRWVRLINSMGLAVPIVIGGPISVLGEKLTKWLGVSVWRGESEDAFPAAVKGLSFNEPKVYEAREISETTLDTLLPDWGSFDMETYAKNPVGFVNRRKWLDGKGDETTPRSMNVLAARGCPRHCTFCSKNFVYQRYRTRGARWVVNEMAVLLDKYGIKYFHTSDDNSTANRKWLLEFCLRFKKWLWPFGCSWGCAGRVDSLDLETLKIMKDSGCLGVGLGVESGSQRILDVYRKGVSVKQNEDAILACKEVFGSADYSLMVGAPGEDDRSVDESIELCRRTKTAPAITFFTTPIPGSKIYSDALSGMLIQDEKAYLLRLGENSQQIACNVSGRSDEWLMAAKKRLDEAVKEFRT